MGLSHNSAYTMGAVAAGAAFPGAVGADVVVVQKSVGSEIAALAGLLAVYHIAAETAQLSGDVAHE